MVFVGTVLYGFCEGAFGRDSYDDKRIEAVGVDWIVARAVDNVKAAPEFAQFSSSVEMIAFVERVSQKPTEG